MIGLPSGARVWLAVGRTDMRKGFDGLAAAVQERMAQDPFCGHLFVFRGRRGDLLKVLWWDGQGLCLFAKRLEKGRFVWPFAGRRQGGDHSGSARDAAGGDRLAHAAADLAAACGRVSCGKVNRSPFWSRQRPPVMIR
jgi:transposase